MGGEIGSAVVAIVCGSSGANAKTITSFTPFADLFDLMHGGDGTVRGWTILNGDVYARRTFQRTGQALGPVTEAATLTLRRAAAAAR